MKYPIATLFMAVWLSACGSTPTPTPAPTPPAPDPWAHPPAAATPSSPPAPAAAPAKMRKCGEDEVADAEGCIESAYDDDDEVFVFDRRHIMGGLPSSCTSDEIRAMRQAAAPLTRKGDHAGARKRLGNRPPEACLLEPGDAATPNLEYFWYQSELAYATYRSSDVSGCLRILAPLMTPSSPHSLAQLGLESSEVGIAIARTHQACSQASAR